MKRLLLYWGIVTTIFYIAFAIIIFQARYLVDNSVNYITVYQYDVRLSVSIILSIVFVALMFGVVYVMKSSNNDFLKKPLFKFIYIIPIYPIVTGLLWLLFDVLGNNDRTSHFIRGSEFITGNPDSFASSMTVDQIVAVGKNLEFGVGVVLTGILLLIMAVNHIVFMVKYPKMIEMDL